MRRLPWACDTAIVSIYIEAKLATSKTGVHHEVDHIIPLKHPRVCGLHTQDNLCVIPALYNRAKKNRLPAALSHLLPDDIGELYVGPYPEVAV